MGVLLSMSLSATTVHEVKIYSLIAPKDKISGLDIKIKKGKSVYVPEAYKKKKKGVNMGLIPIKGVFKNKNDLYWLVKPLKTYKKYLLNLDGKGKKRLIVSATGDDDYKLEEEENRFDEKKSARFKRTQSFDFEFPIRSSSSLLTLQIENKEGDFRNEGYFIKIPAFEELNKQFERLTTKAELNKLNNKYKATIIKIAAPGKLISRGADEFSTIEKDIDVIVRLIQSNSRNPNGRFKVFVHLKGNVSKNVKRIAVLEEDLSLLIRKKVRVKKDGSFGLLLPMIWSHAHLRLMSFDRKCKGRSEAQIIREKLDCYKKVSSYIFSHREWNDGAGGKGFAFFEDFDQGKPYLSFNLGYGASSFEPKDVDVGFKATLPSKSHLHLDFEWKTLIKKRKYQWITHLSFETLERFVPVGFDVTNAKTALFGLDFGLKLKIFKRVVAELFVGAKQQETAVRIFASDKIKTLTLGKVITSFAGGGFDFRWLDNSVFAFDIDTRIAVLFPLSSGDGDVVSGGFQTMEGKLVFGHKRNTQWGLSLKGIHEQHTTEIAQNSVFGVNAAFFLKKEF
jgi:hypothetical protein